MSDPNKKIDIYIILEYYKSFLKNVKGENLFSQDFLPIRAHHSADQPLRKTEKKFFHLVKEEKKRPDLTKNRCSATLRDEFQ